MTAPDVGSERTCPACGAAAAPETDAELHYFECEECGYAFGWMRSGDRPADQPAGVCAAGIPLVPPPEPQRVILRQIGKPRER